MKILIHSHLFPNPVNTSFGTFVYYAATALTELDIQVVVVAPVPYVLPGISKKNRWYRFKDIPEKRVEGNLVIYHPRFFSIPRRICFSFRGDIMYLTAIRFYKKLFKENKFDLIHCHVALPDGVVGTNLKEKYKIPFGITIHGADLYESIPESPKNFTKIKRVFENADFVGVVSKKLENLILKYQIKSKSGFPKIVYNGIGIPSHLPEVVWTDGNKNSIRLLSVGHAIKRKGYEFVLKSFSKLCLKYNNLYYYIIGDGIDLDYFKKIAIEVGVEHRTFFLGELPNDMVHSYMKKCDIFVLPSWNEAFGIAFIEAMYWRKIVIGCTNEGIAEVIRDGINGFLVPPRDEIALEAKLDFVISNLDNLDAIRNEAKNTITNQFSWKKNALDYLKIYQEILCKTQ